MSIKAVIESANSDWLSKKHVHILGLCESIHQLFFWYVLWATSAFIEETELKRGDRGDVTWQMVQARIWTRNEPPGLPSELYKRIIENAIKCSHCWSFDQQSKTSDIQFTTIYTNKWIHKYEKHFCFKKRLVDNKSSLQIFLWFLPFFPSLSFPSASRPCLRGLVLWRATK